mmetsp:Transcript_45092/g.52154  ORF Transcript_45092/g.52154 Transcript_45092/m.52154 type:complete len:149 (-) Transcript_45092:229-675(-)
MEEKKANEVTTEGVKTEEKKPVEKEPEDPKITEFKNKFVDKTLKITLIDKRILYGKLSCLDSQKNIVLTETIEEIADEFIAPVNSQLTFLAKQQIVASNYLGFAKEHLDNTETMAAVDKEFKKNKFYLGQTTVQGKSIAKIEVQKKAP